MRLIKYLFLLFVLLIAQNAIAQYTNVHYIAPSPWSYFNRYNELVITTTSTTPVAVTIAASDGTVYSNSSTTVAGTPLRYRFSALHAAANYSGVVLSGQGLKVSASVPIGVQVRNIASDNYTYGGLGPGDLTACVQKGNTSFTSLGDQGVGTSFRVGYYANVTGISCYSGETGAPLYGVMAINSNTNIYVNGALLTTLNAGQSYLFQAAIGSSVTSSGNIVLNTGMRGDNSSGCGDGVESQVIPVNNLGNTYIVIRSNGNTGYERSTIVATKPNTTVTVTVPSTNTTTNYTLTNAGSFVTINNGDGITAYSSCYITSNNSVAVYSGSADGCEIDMIVQPPLNNCAGSFDVQTNQFLNNSNANNSVFPYFGYVIIKSDTAIVYFNGTNLESIVGRRTQIGTTGYYLIRYTNTQLGNPANLRFVVNARINVALIESGAGYSMSAFISSISNPMPPPSASSNCLPTTFTAQGGFNSYQWYKDSVAISGAVDQTYVPATSGLYSVTGTNQNCGTSSISTAVAVNPKPNAGADQIVCNNSTVTLTGTNPTTNTWIAQANNPAGATLSNTTNGIATVSLNNAAVGNYNFIYSAGCADTVSVFVKATSKSLTTASICAGNSYSFNGKTYTASTIDTARLINSVGCDSLAILNLTVKPTSASTTIASICAGGAYTFNGTAYTTSGTYINRFTNSVGCDSIATLILTVNATSSSTTTASICAGTSYAFNGTTYTTAGTYTARLTNSRGCDSIATLVLSVKATSSSTTTASICSGNTYTFNGVSYSNAGTYTARLTNSVGCDSIATLILSVKSPSSSTTNASIVSGNTYTFNGSTYTTPGTYTARLTNSVGCDSIATLVLSVVSLSSTNASICSGSSYTFNGVVYTTSGTYSATLKNMYGFDSTATLNLTVKSTSSSTTNISICSGDTYTFNGVAYTSAGTYTTRLTNSVGCDSTAILVLTVKAKSTSTTNASICAGNSYTFNGVTYNSAGTYSARLTNRVGCDSTATLILSVKQPSSSITTAVICAGNSYTFNGISYTTSGTYTKNLTNSVGCDSIATLNLTVKPTSSSTITASICSGSSYSFNGTNYTASGTYTVRLTNSVGCDSLAILALTVNANPTIAAITGVSAICVGTNTTFASTTSGGVWSASNSSSVATINSSTGIISPFGSGVSVITYTVTNANGCSSQVTKSLNVNPVPSVAPIGGASSTCIGSSTVLTNSSYGGVWTSSNTNIATVASDGTVSGISVGNVLINYTLATATCGTTVSKSFNTVGPSASNTNASICSSALPYSWNGLTFNAAGTQIAYLTNYVGCDSLATLNLTVKATSASITNTSICPSALPYSWNGLTLNAAGTYTKTLINAVGCDSIATLNLTVKATSVSTTNASICAGSSYTFNGTVYTAAGTYTKTLFNAVGCDSVATLNLTIKATSASTTNASICEGGSYTFNGTVYTTAGIYTKTLVNAVGCDSVATLVLTVKATSASTTNTSICPNALPYSWNGLILTAAGTYTKTLINAVGCDSIATLNLTVKATSASTTNATICAGGSYTFNGTVYTTAGTYTKTLTNTLGCDSIATLVLTVKATSASTTNASICAGGSYTFNGTVYTTAGTYTKTLTNAVGCDSIATLVLIVNALPNVTIGQTGALTSCTSGNLVLTANGANTYLWNNNSTLNSLNVSVGGTYSVTGTDINGCKNTANITINNFSYPNPIQALGLTSVCSDTPSVNLKWRVTNNNAIDIPYSWTISGTSYSGTGSAIANAQSFFSTVRQSTNTLILSYYNQYCTLQSVTKSSGLAACSPNISGATVPTICSADNGSITINVSNGALPYTYLWSNGATTQNISNVLAGSYSVKVTASTGAFSTANFVVSNTTSPSNSMTNASICAGVSYTFNGTVYTTAGTYTKTLTNAVGCDSVATLVLIVKATSASTTNTSICPSALPYSWNGLTLTAAGTYTKTLVNAVGCDSIATLNLTVKATSASTTNTSVCPSALPYSWNGLTLNAAGTYTKTLVNAVGCDSVATLVLTVNPTSSSTTTASICSGNTYIFNGMSFTTTGTYSVRLTNRFGCDSVARLRLIVKPISSSTTNVSICAGGSYTFNGTVYTAAGTYTKTLTNTSGCDSVATLNLTVKATSASTTNTSICQSALPYSWNGLTLTTAGTYTKNLTNAVGCDSVATLNLIVKATSASTTTVILCAGNTYTFNGVTYNTPGTYVAHLTNYLGCDSVATLVLVGGAATASTTTISICPSALPYLWNGLTFNAAGTQTAHLTNTSGCDSAATLVLTVKAASTSTTNATICGGNSYMFNGVAYTTSGTFIANLVSSLGCDSTATLVLTVLPKPNAGVDKTVSYNNGNGSVILSGVGSGVWLANASSTGSSVIVDPTNATTEVKNFSAIGTYEYLYINGACSDTMKVSVLPNGNISSYVWVDTNEDGINNESTTNGINNVVIELYKEDANGNYVLAQTTTTATFNGKRGYYNFVIPENGNYKVKFPLVAQDGALTTQNLSTNTTNNSVADPATGFSPVIAINTKGSGLSLNNNAVGAGYKYVASPNCNMTATIGVNQLSQCVTNNQYQFTGNFTGGTAPFTYLWDLNDGNYANSKDVTYTYATAGEHDVTFIVKDSRGCEAHASTVQIAVGAKPKASFDIYTHTGNGDGFTFVSTSTISGGWMNYSWNLGNGTTSTLINPMTTYSPGTYTVTLVVTGNFGCSDTITKLITVDSSNNYCSGPLANFSVNNIAQCLSGNSFVFTNTSTGNNNTYTWNFGDGTAASSNFNEQHTFNNTGTYSITLIATNTCGTNTVTKTVTVNGAPATPTAITGPTSVTLGGVIGLTNATTGGVWSSANTAVATINNYGIVTGISAGNTVITYTVANTCGTTSVDMPVTVLAANSNCIAPIANFTINTNTQCLVGNNFTFSNSASGTALAYNWNFGDATTANSANASHAFTQAGVYSVKLIVTNTCGTDSISKTVTVNTAPTQPQAITGNNSIATGGTTTLSSTTVGGVWSSSNTAFATVSANGLVTGITSGSATITYTVTNSCGSASASKIVLVSQLCVPTSSTTTASICAGNSYTFNGAAYLTAGTYVANLTNAAGCDSMATLVLSVKQPTSSTTTASICAGTSYTFNGTTYTSAGTYMAYLTNATGCDSTATLILTLKATSTSAKNASICAGTSYTFNGTAYTTAGTYVAHLTNAAGCDSAATLVLTVNSLPTTLPSISGNTSLSVGTTSLLSNSVTGGTWSSSNTSIATVNANNGLVTGLSAGTTVITYTITDACSNIVNTTTSVTVSPAIIPCTVNASFSVNNAQQCVTGNQFVFTNTTTGGIAPYTYLWQISEGSSVTTKDFTKAFATYGEHDVHLKVIDANGCESNATAKHIIIGAKPVANFSVLSNTGNGASKTFISASTLAAGNMSYMWDLGNGMTSTLVNPTVTYIQGTYTVKLVVSGIGTCKDSVSQVINEVGVANVSVYPNPVVNTVQVSYRAASTTVTTIKLMDLNGRIIQTQQVLPVSVGTNLSAMFDFRNLQPGSYVIHVSDAQNGFLGSKTILKQ